MPQCYRTVLEKNSVFLKMLQKFSFDVNDIVRNARISLDQEEGGQNLHIRGRIREISDEHSKDISNLKLKFFEESFRRQIKELIAEDQGINPSNFMNVEIFKLEIQKRIKEAGDDSANFVDRIK